MTDDNNAASSAGSTPAGRYRLVDLEVYVEQRRNRLTISVEDVELLTMVLRPRHSRRARAVAHVYDADSALHTSCGYRTLGLDEALLYAGVLGRLFDPAIPGWVRAKLAELGWTLPAEEEVQ